jgi:tetratricopeptide (TPR) repeat protein
MCRRLFLLVLVVCPLLAPARDKPESWIEIRSPHFSVLCNSNEIQARHVADQFERMRSVFHTLFPKIQIDTLGSITVLAVKDEKDFRELEPAEYLAKGQLKLGGLFLRGADKNYVLLRLDAGGEHPYAVVYHEYTHFLLSKEEWLPLWLNEGLAEFYQNTDIREKEVELGEPSKVDVYLLRENRLLPLATLLTVDHTSPYYHEENKGSIFYSESWALTHYLEMKDYHDKTHRIADYSQLLSQNVDAVTAATRAFGDLKQLQSLLEGYVQRPTFRYVTVPGASDVDDAAFQAQVLAVPQADAVRADFLANNGRTADARALLQRILQDDPNNVLAHETMGLLEFRERHIDEAQKWYAQAVKLDSQSYLAHYYFAAIAMKGPVDAAEESQVESSLRASIKLNPNFAPSYDRLAMFLTMHHRNLDEARMMALSAVGLEPGNLGYRMDTANVLLQMERGKDAVTVIRDAMHLASSPQETDRAAEFLRNTEEYAEAQEQNQRFDEQRKTRATAEALSHAAEANVDDDPVPTGPHHFAVGVLKNVHCNTTAMDLKVIAGRTTLGLHSDNYFEIDYSSLGVTLKVDFNPCKDLEGRAAKIEYVESSSTGSAAVVSIKIHK